MLAQKHSDFVPLIATDLDRSGSRLLAVIYNILPNALE